MKRYRGVVRMTSTKQNASNAEPSMHSDHILSILNPQ